MSFIYSLIAREPNVVLVEYTEYTGNFGQASHLIIEKGVPKNTQTVIPYDKYKIHIIYENSLIYFCFTEDVSDEQAFAFLNDLKNKLLKTYQESELLTKNAYSLKNFEITLEQYMNYYNSHPTTTKAGEIIKELNIAKNVAIENIEKIFQREEKIEIIASKSQNLENYSYNAKTIADNIRKNEKKNSHIIMIIIAVIIILFILFFII